MKKPDNPINSSDIVIKQDYVDELDQEAGNTPI